MAYTLRGRLESRLAAALLPVLAAAALAGALETWWPLELAGLMLGVGLAFDVAAYHRLLPYQAGWLAFPLGLVELAAVMGLAIDLGIRAPLAAALGLFGGAWLVAQVLGHAGFPRWRLTYAEDGGELGRWGAASAVAVLAVFAGGGFVYHVTRPPIVTLGAGVHRGPLVLDRAQRLIGKQGAIVLGGLVITADDVTVKNVMVVGGENGIEVLNAERVKLEDVQVSGAELDGIHVRRSQVEIRDCAVDSPRGYTQGIDISFSADMGMSLVEGCTLRGGQEGIVTHSAVVAVRKNRVEATSLRGITITEMSMGSVDRNEVEGAFGVGIFCGDYSHCEIEDNRVLGTRVDGASEDLSRLGYGVVVHFGAEASLSGNHLWSNPRSVYASADTRVTRE